MTYLVRTKSKQHHSGDAFSIASLLVCVVAGQPPPSPSLCLSIRRNRSTARNIQVKGPMRVRVLPTRHLITRGSVPGQLAAPGTPHISPSCLHTRLVLLVRMLTAMPSDALIQPSLPRRQLRGAQRLAAQQQPALNSALHLLFHAAPPASSRAAAHVSDAEVLCCPCSARCSSPYLSWS